MLSQAILAGDFILSAASMALARIGNNTVVSVLSQVIEDLVRGKDPNKYVAQYRCCLAQDMQSVSVQTVYIYPFPWLFQLLYTLPELHSQDCCNATLLIL